MNDRKESDARVPGWKIIRFPDRGTIRYRSPNGEEVGAWAYNSVLKHYQKTGVASPSPLGTRWKAFQKDGTVSPAISHDNSGSSISFDVPNTDEQISIDIPEASPRSTKRSGLFSSRELSLGYSNVFIILTSIIAMALQLPEAQMNEVEIKAISIPLGNITERSKYNRTVGKMLVNNVDYMQLGYALYLYFDRVSKAMRERSANNRSIKDAGQTKQPISGQPGTNGHGTGSQSAGVFLRPTPTGHRGITGIN